jgi:hypothetical protein
LARKRKRVVSDRGKEGVEGVLAERDGDDAPVISPFFTWIRNGNGNGNGKGKGKEKEKEDLEEPLDMGGREGAIGAALEREAAMENGQGGPTVEIVAEGQPGEGAGDMSMMQDGDILAGLDEALATGGSSGFGGKKAPFALVSLRSFSLDLPVHGSDVIADEIPLVPYTGISLLRLLAALPTSLSTFKRDRDRLLDLHSRPTQQTSTRQADSSFLLPIPASTISAYQYHPNRRVPFLRPPTRRYLGFYHCSTSFNLRYLFFCLHHHRREDFSASPSSRLS